MKKTMSIHQLSLFHCKYSGNESLSELQDIRSNHVLMMTKYPQRGPTWNKLSSSLEKLDKIIAELLFGLIL
jgi:hypothetical protein